jgi:hypothetical protein
LKKINNWARRAELEGPGKRELQHMDINSQHLTLRLWLVFTIELGEPKLYGLRACGV